MTFKAYFRRYESIFEKDCEEWPDKEKVRLLLGKFTRHVEMFDFHSGINLTI